MSEQSAFGFDIGADRPLRFLRDDGADGLITVRSADHPISEPVGSPVVEWDLRGRRGAFARLYQQNEQYCYWSGGGATLIDPSARTVVLPPIRNSVLWEEHLWGMPALLCFADRGDFPLHAAAVEIGGNAILLAAPGRHGKTTLALEFHAAGHRVLGEDLACCRLDQGTLSVVPGPALLRVRPDVLNKERDVPDIDVVLRHPERVYMAIQRTRRGSGRPVPVAAVVFLRVSEAGVIAEPVRPPAALPDLWALSFKLPGAQARSNAFRNMTGIADRVPIWNVHRPLNHAAVGQTMEAIGRIAEGLT